MDRNPALIEPPLPIEGGATYWDHRVDDDHYEQPRNLFRKIDPEQQQLLFENTARNMGDARLEVKQRHIANCAKADPAYGAGVAKAARVYFQPADDGRRVRPAASKAGRRLGPRLPRPGRVTSVATHVSGMRGALEACAERCDKQIESQPAKDGGTDDHEDARSRHPAVIPAWARGLGGAGPRNQPVALSGRPRARRFTAQLSDGQAVRSVASPRRNNALRGFLPAATA